MSNVLIGIIGVILFIGLALAGALFLGPRFQEATSNSKAAAVSTQLRQIASAINLKELDTGSPMLASNATTNITDMVPGYLKSVPLNAATGHGYNTVDRFGTSLAEKVDHVFTYVGNDAHARTICKAIERQAGSTDPEASMAIQTEWATGVSARKRLGCFLYENGNYYAFIPA